MGIMAREGEGEEAILTTLYPALGTCPTGVT